MGHVIARSRIGFWTAFLDGNRAVLNVRRPTDLVAVTIVLTDAETAIIAGGREESHALASTLARDFSRHADVALPTPPRGADEPEAHEWEPSAEVTPVRRLAA
jgi:hypothetical protein